MEGAAPGAVGWAELAARSALLSGNLHSGVRILEEALTALTSSSAAERGGKRRKQAAAVAAAGAGAGTAAEAQKVRGLLSELYLPCTFPVPSLYLP